jgi:hypothetical protein
MICVHEPLEVTILGRGSHFQIYEALYVLFNLENSLDCSDIIFGLLCFVTLFSDIWTDCNILETGSISVLW